MPDFTILKGKVNELAERKWDDAAIAERINTLIKQGIPHKKLDIADIKARKKEILDRVQSRAEENNYYLKSCAQGTALALLEEFGMGNMEIIKALTPFPGIGSSGGICGGVSGSLIAFGLFFGSDTPPEPEKTGRTMGIAKQFLTTFNEKIGSVYCADIIHTVLGHKCNPGESQESMAQFTAEKGIEKCGLAPGIGARLAAGLIIDNM